jgi:DNA polymerase III subunit beta
MLYELHTFLPIAEKVYDRKTSVDILHSICIRDGFIMMTDLNIFVRMPIKNTREPDRHNYTLPIKILKKILLTKPTTISIEKSTEDKLTIEFDTCKIIVPTENADDYPAFPDSDKFEKIAEWNRDVFMQLAKQITFASVDILRASLTGILVKQDGYLSSVATDGHVLQWIKNLDTANKCLHFKEYECIIPAKVLKIIGRYVQYKTEVWQSEKYLMFKLGHGIEFVVKKIDEPYVNFKRVIPIELPNTLTLNREQILKHIKSAKNFSNSNTKQAELSAKNGSVEFKTQDIDQGTEFSSKMEVEKREGAEMDVALNLALLEKSVNAMEGELIEWKYIDGDGPNILNSAEDENTLNLLMPVRRDNG